MNIEQHTQPEQWLVLIIFFVGFTISGLFNRPRAQQLEYFHFIMFGILSIVANIAVLYFLNNNSLVKHNILNSLILRDFSIEASFIIFGYCLMFRGLGQFIRLQFGSKYSSQF